MYILYIQNVHILCGGGPTPVVWPGGIEFGRVVMACD